MKAVFLRLRISMSVTGRRDRIHRHANRFQFRDLHAGLAGNVDQMLPGKCVRPLCGELVAERYRVVVVEEDKMLAHRQVQPLLDDQPVFDGAGNGAYVHDAIRADEGFSCCIHSVVICVLFWLLTNNCGR